MRRRRACLLAVGAALATTARAAPPALTPADERAIRGVVESQLAAFAAGDAERAFSYASPAIRAQFGSAARFIEMVRGGYPVLLRPAAVSFLRPEQPADGVVQGVRLRDAAGVEWLAVYEMERQPPGGGGWRIGAVRMVRSAGRST